MGIPAPKLTASKSNAEYTQLIEKLDTVPTLPSVAVRVNELIGDPNSSSADIAEVLKKDQVLTAKVLRLINSPYYGIPGQVTDVKRALAYLGFNTIAQLVLGISVVSVFKEAGGLDMRAFWQHALGAAVTSELLAARLKLAKPEEVFTCGLLHDIGKLVLYCVDPARLTQILAEAKARAISFDAVEREQDLPGHAFLGEQIAIKWGLPQIIRTSIRHHHHDVSKMATLLPSEKPVVQIVRLANQLCVRNQIGHSGDCSAGEVTQEMIAPLGLTLEDVAAIEAKVAAKMESAGGFLNAVG